MIWWNSKHDTAVPGRPSIKILNTNARDNVMYDYLSNSNGACCLGWASMGGQRRAASLLAMTYEAIVRDGVPAAEAHQELMQIDEYREWLERFEGPFADVYRGDPVREVENV
jgi:hypothetical protein